MPPGIQDVVGDCMIVFRNTKKLLYDGLNETFKVYGKIATILEKGNRIVHIRYVDKESALKCYQDLCNHPDFMVEFPQKPSPVVTDVSCENALEAESNIGFYKLGLNASTRHQKFNTEPKTDSPPNISNDGVPSCHYLRLKRKIIQSRAFKRFMIALSACNLYKTMREDRESLLSELVYQLRGVNLDFQTGFFKETEDDSNENEIPQLILAKDFIYFQNVRMERAVDVLICNLPPWYREADLYKLVFRLIPNDFLGIDWYRTYASGTIECTFPYAIIYVTSEHAGCVLRYGVDGLILDSHKISVCLMEDVECMLLEVRNSLYRLI